MIFTIEPAFPPWLIGGSGAYGHMNDVPRVG